MADTVRNISGDPIEDAVCSSPNKDARVFIGDGSTEVELPTADSGIEVSWNKEGSADLTGIAYIEAPIRWRGVNVIQHVRAFYGDQRMQRVRIEMRPKHSSDPDAYSTVFAGFTNGIGSAGNGKTTRIRVLDMCRILDGIRYSANFRDSTAIDVLEDIKETVDEKMLFQDELPLVTPDTELFQRELEDTETRSGAGWFHIPTFGSIDPTDPSPFSLPSGPKTFQNNRHSARDALEWCMESIGGFWYIEYSDERDEFVLVVDTDPVNRSFQDHHVDGEGPEVTIYENEALFELRPLNSLRLVGSSASSVMGIESDLFGVPSKTFPSVHIRHSKLYEMAHETELSPPLQESEATTIDRAIQVAKSRLKRYLDSNTGGDLELALRPDILPYSRLTVSPYCTHQYDLDEEPPALDLEVEEVRHIVSPDDGKSTWVAVSIYVGMEDDIEVVSATMEDI